jgi:cytosine/uracil/thiamine/allantoin permease
MLICYQKQTNTKQNKQIAKKYQKEKKRTWIHLLSIWLSSVHIIFTKDAGN